MTVLPELYLPVQKVEQEPMLRSANRTHRQTGRVPTFCAHANSETSDSSSTVSGLDSSAPGAGFSLCDEYTASILRYNQQLKEKKGAPNRSPRKIFSLKKLRVFDNGHERAPLFSSPTTPSRSSPLTPSPSLSSAQADPASAKAQSHRGRGQGQGQDQIQGPRKTEECELGGAKGVSDNSRCSEEPVSCKFAVHDACSIAGSSPLFSDPLTRTLSDGLSGATLTDKKAVQSHTTSASASWSSDCGAADNIATPSPQPKTCFDNSGGHNYSHNCVHASRLSERSVASCTARRFLGLSYIKHKRHESTFDSHTLRTLDDVTDSDDDLASLCDDGFAATNFIKV